ncbi:unnamed protein product (macronuclear) [Paramecium tetraurelia]|uniref:Uncharacterized protein n=1 Tax=Paramecium tetraurelia TaxID=5888 RepID=A0E272_PARTE|nr:uncharacterized protein GSPATT00022561001 [Paramecium tetraurelia]CAK89389.1 unnamed protein product [Paramecium tetraurelia]|eukprot:XP_001456786.1 hypothetical protein (macronuclear) [Paramecium tetraurelia strain d4-2]
MYKLNTIQGHSFFNFQTPINHLTKKNLFQSANEIKPKRKNSNGTLSGAQSLPKEFWFRDYDRSITGKKQKKEQHKANRHQNPIYYIRNEQQTHLLTYQNRPCTSSPSKKWKQYRNIILNKKSSLNMTSNLIKQKFQETLHLLIPSKSQQSPKSDRCSLPSSNKLTSNLNGTIIKQLKKLNRLESDRTEYIPSLLSIDKQIKDSSISQSNVNNNSLIQNKEIFQKQLITRNRFLKDSCRLYGLDWHVRSSIKKLVFSDSIQFSESCETKCDKIENSPKSIEKSNYKQNNLLKLINKQKEKQQSQKQRSCSTSLKKNKNKSSNNRVINVYFPSLQMITKRNFS